MAACVRGVCYIWLISSSADPRIHANLSIEMHISTMLIAFFCAIPVALAIPMVAPCTLVRGKIISSFVQPFRRGPAIKVSQRSVSVINHANPSRVECSFASDLFANSRVKSKPLDVVQETVHTGPTENVNEALRLREWARQNALREDAMKQKREELFRKQNKPK